MRKAWIAEELLSLTTSRERAESIAGDLVEEAGKRGGLRFYASLAGVALALFFRAFGLARGQALRLFGFGLAMWFALYAAVRTAGALAGIQPLVIPVAESATMSLGVQLYLAATLMLSNFLAGFALGGRAASTELNAAMPLAMFWAVSAILAPLIDWAAGTSTWYCTFLYLLGLPLCYVVPLLAGAALGRRRGTANEAVHP